MPALAVNNFNIILSVLGGWISLFGLVSYLCKENFYLSEACMCLSYISSCRRKPADCIPSDIALGWSGIVSPCKQLDPPT